MATGLKYMRPSSVHFYRWQAATSFSGILSGRIWNNCIVTRINNRACRRQTWSRKIRRWHSRNSFQMSGRLLSDERRRQIKYNDILGSRPAWKRRLIGRSEKSKYAHLQVSQIRVFAQQRGFIMAQIAYESGVSMHCPISKTGNEWQFYWAGKKRWKS